MKRICFITGTRADYGIMKPVMRRVEASRDVELQIVATNAHLSPEYGMTVREIENDGFKVDVKIESLVSGGTPSSVVMSMAKVQEGLAEAFENLKPDLAVILGDRYEALAAASAAVVFNIPVAHLHGGETTEGAIDNRFRHAITQLSTLHFAATPQYVEKIVSMGISPEMVYHSGAPGADSPEGELDRENMIEFYETTGLRYGEPFILLAFHPVTLLPDKGLEELRQLLKALNNFLVEGYKVLVTMPNSDPGNMAIRNEIQQWKDNNPDNVIAVESLGASLFHVALELASTIVGNSSAALIEAPSHRVSSVNVGIRQKGRAHGLSVIDVPADSEKIRNVITGALSLEMKSVLMGLTVSSLNPYYKPEAASFIADTLIDFVLRNK